MALTKSKLKKWLLAHDFEPKPSTAGPHDQYKHRSSGVVVTITSHGRSEFSKKHTGMMLRQLETAGFNKERTRRELGV